jgi:hypothetical protein
MYCSNNIYFNTEDGYYYIVNDWSHTAYITEDEAVQVQEPCRG